MSTQLRSATPDDAPAVALAAGVLRIGVETQRDNHAARAFCNAHGYHERSIQTAMDTSVLDGVRLEKWLQPQN